MTLNSCLLQNDIERIKSFKLFDGISCGQLAFQRAGIPVDTYYASEIEESSISVALKNYPNTIEIGDVTQVNGNNYTDIDLLIGGSPCQGFSIAGKQLNFDDPRSKLFWEYVRILNEVKPKYFLLENVKMKQEWVDIISEELGVKPIEINSSLVTAQNRPRLYWTNIPNVKQPKDKNLSIKNVIEENAEFTYIEEWKTKNRTFKKNYMQYDINGRGNGSQDQRAYYLDGKCGCLDTGCGSKHKLLCEDGRVRKFTKKELERLQTLPDGYTDGIPISKATSSIGNGWTVDVIAHIFSYLKNGELF